MSHPVDESGRQRALDLYHLVDSLPETAYDDIVRLAAVVCGVPTALISLIDRDRQWFKARIGFEPPQTSRDIAFCDHAVRSPGALLEVPDARLDPRFANNPLVTGPDAVRFYAGMPLVTPGGAAIGTVCVLDSKPRQMSPEQRDALSALARLTMNLLEARQRAHVADIREALEPEPVAPGAPPVDLAHCSVAIFELQNHAGVIGRLGQRAVERAMERLVGELEGVLVAGRGDTVSRVSDSAELIVVLHGTPEATAPRLAALEAACTDFEHHYAVRILSSCSHSAFDNERLEFIYLRADEGLTAAKDAEAGAAV